jgi:hypothetical protein
MSNAVKKFVLGIALGRFTPTRFALARHHKSRHAFVCSITAFVFSVFAQNANAADSFRLVTNGPAGEYISGGQPKLFVSPAQNQFPDPSDRSAPSGTDYFRFFATYGGGEFISVTVATNGLNRNLASGAYADAERAPFATAGHPGLDVTMQGRGCNTVSGSFVIHSVNIAPDQSVDFIDVSFSQLCEGQLPALVGRFTYSAAGLPIQARAPYELDAPQAVPSLELLHLLFLGLGIFTLAIRFRRQPA